jgi:copper transport protein
MKILPTWTFIGLAILPLSVHAHAKLTQAMPADGSVLTTVPDHFMLMFSDSAHLTALSIQKQGDANPQKIAPLPKEASAHFMIPAPPLDPGSYTLTYRVVAADDNHVSSGTIRFSVSTGAKPAEASGK